AAARKLVADGEYARVSPDGSQIGFTRVAHGRTEIWTIRPGTGEAHEVLAGSATQEEYLSRVAWSPDSQKIGYVRTTVRSDGNVDRAIEIFELAGHKVKI